MSFEQVDPSLPGRLREFHERLSLAGNPPNALLSLPDDRNLYLTAVLRDTPNNHRPCRRRSGRRSSACYGPMASTRSSHTASARGRRTAGRRQKSRIT